MVWRWDKLLKGFGDPDLNRDTTNYRYNHKCKDAVEITLHFINIKYLNMLTNIMEIRIARAMVAYLWEEILAATCPGEPLVVVKELACFDNSKQLDLLLASVLHLGVHDPISCGLLDAIWI